MAVLATVLVSLSAAQLPPDAANAQRNNVPASAADLFRQAKHLLSAGGAEQARQMVAEGLKRDPHSSLGYNLLGLIDGQEKDYKNAESNFQKALALDSRSADTHNNLGNCYVAENKLDLAVKEFRAALHSDPANRGANYNLGLVLLAQKHPREAIIHFQRVHPTDISTLFNLTQAYFAAGERQKGLEAAQRLSAQGKNDVRLHFTLGVLLASNKQFAAASRELEAADSLEPGTFEVLYNLGQVYNRNNEPTKAEAILVRALKIRPDSPETLYFLARAHANQGRELDALDLLVRARKLAPRNTDIIFLMARLSMNEHFYGDAIPLLEEGLKINPDRPDFHAALGDCYFTVGKIDRALEEFQTLIKIDPSARSYAFLGLGYRHLGRFEEARKCLEQGLKLNPNNAACLYNMGYIANRQGKYNQAEKWLEEAIRVNPDYADALLELATAKMHESKYEEAIPLLRKFTLLDPHPAPAYFKLATAERKLHQMGAAERDLKIFQTLSKDPNPGPYPYQHLFDYLDQRAGLAPRQQSQIDLEQLQQDLTVHPGRPQNLYLLAATEMRLGRLEEAKQAIEQLDRISQGDFRTAVGVGVLFASHHIYPEAIEHFQAALEANPGSDDTWFDLADAYFRARDYPKALTAIGHISAEGQRDTSYLYLLGDIEAHLGRTEEAIKLFRQVIRSNPDKDQAYLSLALTYLRSGDEKSAERTLEGGLARSPDSGELFWGMGVFAVIEGKPEQAERYLRKSVDLLPEWPGGYSALGLLYFETGRIDKAHQTLKQFTENGARGALDAERIEQVLSSAAAKNAQAEEVHSLSLAARQQFLQIALSLADQTL